MVGGKQVLNRAVLAVAGLGLAASVACTPGVNSVVSRLLDVPAAPVAGAETPVAREALPLANQAAPDGVLAIQASLVNVAERVAPAVVSINVTTATGAGQGSGFLYSSDGKIVTNNHVVAGARQITVVFADGKRLPARLLGGDAYYDLAVLKVEGENFPVLELADTSSLRVGQLVVAVGNPLGYDHTVTTGVISALNRPVSGSGTNTVARAMLQTDAAINPGNSGGPLVSLDGKVVGVNTQIALDAQSRVPAQGLGFAVPSNVVNIVAPQLAEFGQVRNTGRAWIGVSAGTVTQALADAYRLESPSGAVISAVVADGPAARGGLRAQDVIVAMDGQPVYGSDKLIEALIVKSPNDRVVFDVVRPDGSRTRVTVTLGEAPPAETQSTAPRQAP